MIRDKDAVRTLQNMIVQSGYTIDVDGIYGDQTRQAIERLHVPNWVKTALKEIGVEEIHGIKHNDRVLQYHAVSGGFSTDEVPWCGSFVNWVMHQYNYDTPKYPARAKSWLHFGKTSIIPVLGSIAVKSRTGGGHVCFVVGKNMNGDLYCVGGNQNDEVNIRLYKKESFIDFRVPLNYGKEDLPYYALSTSVGTREA